MPLRLLLLLLLLHCVLFDDANYNDMNNREQLGACVCCCRSLEYLKYLVKIAYQKLTFNGRTMGHHSRDAKNRLGMNLTQTTPIISTPVISKVGLVGFSFFYFFLLCIKETKTRP